MYVSGRTPPRTRTIPSAQARKASAFGPFSFVERKKLPASHVREIVEAVTKAVMRDPRIVGAMTVSGMNRATVEKAALANLMKRDTTARVRTLEARLAKAGPVEAVEIRRALAFARLEGGSK